MWPAGELFWLTLTITRKSMRGADVTKNCAVTTFTLTVAACISQWSFKSVSSNNSMTRVRCSVCFRSTWRRCLQPCTACWPPRSSPFTFDKTKPRPHTPQTDPTLPQCLSSPPTLSWWTVLSSEDCSALFSSNTTDTNITHLYSLKPHLVKRMFTHGGFFAPSVAPHLDCAFYHAAISLLLFQITAPPPPPDPKFVWL